MEHVLQEVLEKIKPVQEEELKVKRFINELVRISKTITGLDSMICGSLGKYTWLRGDHDIDLFIAFDKSISREELEKHGLEFGRKIVKEFRGEHEIKYAEHPYVHAYIEFDNICYDVDIVPCYKIFPGEHIKSAVDRSPLHLEYVLSHLRPELRDDVRLLKQFCKGIEVYGSDTKKLGFSGYICELLVLKYGSFGNVLRSAAFWKPGQLIDFSIERIQVLGNFKEQPLIIIDPTDRERNAAAVVSAENFIRFIKYSRKFMERPSKEFFFPRKKQPLAKREIAELQKRGTKFIAIMMKKTEIIDDIFYPQIRRAVKRVTGVLRHEDFHAIRSFDVVAGDMVMLVFELETWEMPKVRRMEGPPIFSKIHSDEFINKYIYPYLEGIHWTADRKREFLSATDLLKSFVKKPPEKLAEQGIPRNIVKEFSNAKVVEDNAFWKLLKNEEISAKVREKYYPDYL
jgi:tRNA nucleotidyltransferase (CCA-adding enzyme)